MLSAYLTLAALSILSALAHVALPANGLAGQIRFAIECALLCTIVLALGYVAATAYENQLIISAV